MATTQAIGFQSTLPVRGATEPITQEVESNVISIHAPREGSDEIADMKKAIHGQFQSTLPVRGATDNWCVQLANLLISIHAPREGSDSAR